MTATERLWAQLEQPGQVPTWWSEAERAKRPPRLVPQDLGGDYVAILLVLAHLDDRGSPAPWINQAAPLAGQAESTVARKLARLEQLGWVESWIGNNNRRYYALTEES